MGGCRCTYRNCTVKSDGKTHMFHYPVFEKVRCHQWLVNAQKLDFLDLKVSQLKNRVVCQHHFTDDNFMNYRKDKLTFEAIPSEDGPFCDSKTLDIKPITSYPSFILLEDIENDVIINDKKANYSLKYGDFLTNGELIETSRYNKINLTKQNNIIEDVKPSIDLNYDSQVAIFKPCFNKTPVNNVNKNQPQPILIVPPYTELSNELKAGNQITQEFGVVNVVQSNQNYDNIPIYMQSNNQPNIPVSGNQVAIKKEPKIKILSEKKIQLHTPLPIGELKKVSPSTTLNLFKTINNTIKVEEPINNSETERIDNKPSDRLKVLEVLNVGFENTLKESETQNAPVVIELDKAREPQISPSTPKVKNKITPERSAAIEQKRKFNMKMKDVLESCLNKLDEPVKQKKQQKKKTPITKSPPAKSEPIRQNEIKIELQDKSNQFQSNISNIQEYTLAYLDARMKKMENTLLNKIEQNSHSITELKDSFENVKKEEKRLKDAHTSTNEVCYKKFLFQEISKYLSHSLSSSIYEELFNKNSVDIQLIPRRKRRKYI